MPASDDDRTHFLTPTVTEATIAESIAHWTEQEWTYSRMDGCLGLTEQRK
ncbi:unnamed protein product [Sphacelaria rigidula]